MKTLLISTLIVVATVGVFGQQKVTPAQQPQSTQQTQKVNPEQNQVKTSHANVDHKKTTNNTQTKKEPKKESKKRERNEKTETNQQATRIFKCPTCGRTFTLPGSYPKNGICPSDGATLVEIL